MKCVPNTSAEISDAVAALSVAVVSFSPSVSFCPGELSPNEFCFKAMMVS